MDLRCLATLSAILGSAAIATHLHLGPLNELQAPAPIICTPHFCDVPTHKCSAHYCPYFLYVLEVLLEYGVKVVIGATKLNKLVRLPPIREAR